MRGEGQPPETGLWKSDIGTVPPRTPCAGVRPRQDQTPLPSECGDETHGRIGRSPGCCERRITALRYTPVHRVRRTRPLRRGPAVNAASECSPDRQVRERGEHGTSASSTGAGKTRPERLRKRRVIGAPTRIRRVDSAAAVGTRDRAGRSHGSCRFSGPRPADAAYGGTRGAGHGRQANPECTAGPPRPASVSHGFHSPNSPARRVAGSSRRPPVPRVPFGPVEPLCKSVYLLPAGSGRPRTFMAAMMSVRVRMPTSSLGLSRRTTGR